MYNQEIFSLILQIVLLSNVLILSKCKFSIKLSIANIRWIIEKAREFQKNICFCDIDYVKIFDSVDHNKLENSERNENTRPPDLPLEKSVWRSRHNSQNRTWNNRLIPDWERRTLGCTLLSCLFNLYAEQIISNAGLDEVQAGFNIAGRNINNLRYPDDTTHLAESKEELKSLLVKVKEESEKVELKLNIQKSKNMASGPITSWANRWENSGRLYFFGLRNHCRL